MTSETTPAPPARRRFAPVIGLAIGGFVLGIAFAALIFLPRAKTSPAAPPSGGLAVGQPAPDFTLKTLDERQVALSDFTGRPILINFWATWCVPCPEETPELVQVYEARKSEGFLILAINLTSIDALTDVTEFVSDFEVAFPVPLDIEGDVAWRLYQIPGIPTSVFVNRQGIVTRVQIGKMTGEQIRQYTADIID